ncbi:MAG TPA: phage major capsid protein [Alphaproteobacteria bacterium]|nr:phage major capsid protein [Alphaproteobacteria bacterium]
MATITADDIYRHVGEIIDRKFTDFLAQYKEAPSNPLGRHPLAKWGEAVDLEEAVERQVNEALRHVHFEPTNLMGRAYGFYQPRLGKQAARVIRALAGAKGDPHRAAVFAEKVWQDDAVVKALSSSEMDAGGVLLRDEMAAEIIELLRAASVVRSLNPIILPMEMGTLRIPRMTQGSTGAWIGENTTLPATQPRFGQVVLSAKKYGSLVPVSNDLIRRTSPSADMMVRDDLVADIATATDLAFIRGDGTSAQPRGLRHLAAAANVIAANATVTLDNVTTDLGKLMEALLNANVRMLRPGWLFAPRTWRYLITVRDGNGNLVFQPEMSRGTLFGFPFRMTSQIPINLSSNQSEVYFADFADVVVGEATGILLDASADAAYHDGSGVVAAFSLDQTVIRAIVEVDINVRHAESVAVLTGVTWGV